MKSLILLTALLSGCGTGMAMRLSTEYEGAKETRVQTPYHKYRVLEHENAERVYVREATTFEDGFAFLVLGQDGAGPLDSYDQALYAWMKQSGRTCHITARDRIPYGGVEYRVQC